MPGDGATIREVESAMAEQPRGADIIVAGDLNIDLYRTVGRGWDEEIAAVLEAAGLEDLLVHFFPRQ